MVSMIDRKGSSIASATNGRTNSKQATAVAYLTIFPQAVASIYCPHDICIEPALTAIMSNMGSGTAAAMNTLSQLLRLIHVCHFAMSLLLGHLSRCELSFPNRKALCSPSVELTLPIRMHNNGSSKDEAITTDIVEPAGIRIVALASRQDKNSPTYPHDAICFISSCKKSHGKARVIAIITLSIALPNCFLVVPLIRTTFPPYERAVHHQLTKYPQRTLTPDFIDFFGELFNQQSKEFIQLLMNSRAGNRCQSTNK